MPGKEKPLSREEKAMMIISSVTDLILFPTPCKIYPTSEEIIYSPFV